MQTTIFWNTINFSFNAPVSETGFLAENFDLNKKSAYITIGIQDLLSTTNEFEVNEIYSKILKTISNKAKVSKLDYLQKVSINWIDTWCIDDWNTICLMTKEEY